MYNHAAPILPALRFFSVSSETLDTHLLRYLNISDDSDEIDNWGKSIYASFSAIYLLLF